MELTAHRGDTRLLNEEDATMSMSEAEYNEMVARRNEEAWERLRRAANDMAWGEMAPGEIGRLEQQSAAHVHSYNHGDPRARRR